MAEPLTDADLLAQLERDPFHSGVHRIQSLQEAAAALRSRERVSATFSRRSREPVMVVVGGEDE